MSKKADVIEAKGTIYKESGNGYFNVELEEPEGHHVFVVPLTNLSPARFNCLWVTESLWNCLLMTYHVGGLHSVINDQTNFKLV